MLLMLLCGVSNVSCVVQVVVGDDGDVGWCACMLTIGL